MKLTQPPAQLVAALATLAAILATATAGYLFQQNQELAKLAAQPPTLVFKHAVSLQNIKIIDTTNWQTYQSEEYGFEVKYPGGWDDKITPKSEKKAESIVLRDKFGDSLFLGGHVSRPYDEFGSVPPYKDEKIFLGGQPFTLGYYGASDDHSNTIYPIDTNPLAKLIKGSLFFISIYTHTDSSQREVEQILSTFKFIPSTGSTSSPQASSGQAN